MAFGGEVQSNFTKNCKEKLKSNVGGVGLKLRGTGWIEELFLKLILNGTKYEFKESNRKLKKIKILMKRIKREEKRYIGQN